MAPALPRESMNSSNRIPGSTDFAVDVPCVWPSGAILPEAPPRFVTTAGRARAPTCKSSNARAWAVGAGRGGRKSAPPAAAPCSLAGNHKVADCRLRALRTDRGCNAPRRRWGGGEPRGRQISGPGKVAWEIGRGTHLSHTSRSSSNFPNETRSYRTRSRAQPCRS